MEKYRHIIDNDIYHDIEDNTIYNRENFSNLIFFGYNKRSGCHLHVSHDFMLNQIIGKKEVYLFNYDANPNLKMKHIHQERNNFLSDDFFSMDLSQLNYQKVCLDEGDSLCIPPFWFHATNGIDINCSITKVFERNYEEYFYKIPYLYLLKIYNLICENISHFDDLIPIHVIKILILVVVLLLIVVFYNSDYLHIMFKYVNKSIS